MSGLGPGDVGRGWAGGHGQPPCVRRLPEGRGGLGWAGEWDLGSAVRDGGTREGRGAGAVASRRTQGLSSPGCGPLAEAREGQLEDLSMEESFLLASSD